MKLATHWRPLLVLALFLGLSLLIFARSPIVRAADPIQPPSDYQVSQTEMEDYWNATQDCSTPSLECLVRNVSRFTAIEWSFDIVGKDNKLCAIDDSCETSDAAGGSTIARGGAINSLTGLITSMYSHPVASSQTYLADVMRSAHIVPPAYAQGLGFASLDPILNLWKTFRNIAYMFFVLVFVVIGFMIMFRQKIGQTAITAQQAIPQIIMSLVLVTFSFAIAGFIIDLMYVLMVLIVGIFSSFFPQDIFGYTILELAGEIFHGAVNFGRNADFISQFLQGLNFGDAASEVVGVVGGITLTLVLAVALLIGVIRLFFELLKSYATVVIAVVMAPLLLMIGAIPGRSGAFGTWLKTLIGNLSPFPVVLVVLVMYYAFTNGAINASSGGFMPPFLLNAGNGIGDSIIALMSLAIVLALPDIVKHIKDGIAPKNALADLITSKGWQNLKSGYKNLNKGVRYAANTQPFGANEYSRFRLGGKESFAERALVGTRANRKAQVERMQRRIDLGMSAEEAILPIEHGGFVGALRNKRIQQNIAEQDVGSGAGAAPVGTQANNTSAGQPLPQRRPSR